MGFDAPEERPKPTRFRAEEVRRPRKIATLPPLHPNVGIAANYARRLTALIDEMHRSILYWVQAAYRANPPATMAQDDVSWVALRKAMKALADRWVARFNDMSQKLAGYFAKAVSERTDSSLRKILTDGGFMLQDWDLTAAQRDAIGAIVHENVSLIKSIPQQYLGNVERDVMRSVAVGRDIKGLMDDLQAHYGVTRDRAQTIAVDQNNKATAALRRVRFMETEIKYGVWMHSSAGKKPRPTHLEAGRKGIVFEIAKGWFDPYEQKWIQPGELIRCRCTVRPVFPGIAVGKTKAGFAA